MHVSSYSQLRQYSISKPLRRVMPPLPVELESIGTLSDSILADSPASELALVQDELLLDP